MTEAQDLIIRRRNNPPFFQKKDNQEVFEISAENQWILLLGEHPEVVLSKVVVDLGCGLGAYTRRALLRCPEAIVHGFDIFEQIDDLDILLNPRFRFHQGLLPLSLGYEDIDNADLVIASSLGASAFFDEGEIRILLRCMRKGGLFLVTGDNPDEAKWLNHPGFERCLSDNSSARYLRKK